MTDLTDIEDLESELDDSGSDSEPEAKRETRLSSADWERIKLLWEFGTHTLADLSKEFGVRGDGIHKRLKKDGIQKGSRAHLAPINAAENDEIAKQAAESMRRIVETRNDHYRYAEVLARMTMAEVIDAKNKSQAISMKDANLAALNKAAKTLEVLRKERWVLLGLDREDGDPEDMDELMISELSQDQIEAMQAEMRGIEYNDPLSGFVEDDVVDETDQGEDD